MICVFIAAADAAVRASLSHWKNGSLTASLRLKHVAGYGNAMHSGISACASALRVDMDGERREERKKRMLEKSGIDISCAILQKVLAV